MLGAVLGLFRLKKRWHREDLFNIYKYLMVGSKEDGARLFSVVSSDRTRGNRNNVKYGTFHRHRRINFFTVRVAEHWNK